jgi:hypothetical protein
MSIYEQPSYSGIDDLQRAIAADEVMALGTLIVGAALYEEDFDAAYGACLALVHHRDELVRGNALLGFGHIARRFRRIGDEALDLVRAATVDSSVYVRGQAESAAMDLRDYLGLKVTDDMDVEELPDPA